MRADVADEVRAAWARLQPGVDTAPIDIVHRVLRAARLIELSSDAELAAFGLTRPELELLMLLRRTDAALSPSAIAQELLFTAPATSKRLKALEGRGLLSRVVNPADRRGALIGLTDAGRELVDAAFPTNLRSEAKLLATLTPAQHERVTRALRELLTALAR
ncbi:MAG TPA: MarR family transcriptional regulator [Gryllotalpicola sp.]